MKRWGISIMLAAGLALTGCAGAPAIDRTEATATFLHAAVAVESGDLIADAFEKEGLFTGIAEDIVEGCGKTGMPHAYAAQIPDMERVIIQAYDVGCPD